MAAAVAPSRLTALHSVQCLECEWTYAKPVGGGTVWANPGCPHCGYVGWMPVAGQVSARPRPARPAARRRRPLLALSH